MTDQPVTPDREALIRAAAKGISPHSDGPDDLDEMQAELVVDALLPLLTDALDRARQQGRDDENRRMRELLALIADGRAAYATDAPDDMCQVLYKEERVFRLAARVLADDSFRGLLPSWRWTDAATLARGGPNRKDEK